MFDIKKQQPKTFSEAAERVQERQEAPILNDTQVNVLQSGYINGIDDVLAIMERAERDPVTDINKYHGRT